MLFISQRFNVITFFTVKNGAKIMKNYYTSAIFHPLIQLSSGLLYQERKVVLKLSYPQKYHAFWTLIMFTQ